MPKVIIILRKHRVTNERPCITKRRQKVTEGYQREAAYYTKHGEIDRAKIQARYAEDAMDKYKTQLRYASDADDKAAMYLRWAADALKKH